MPCEGGTQPLTLKEIKVYLSLLKTPWEVKNDNKQIEKQYKFKNFVQAVQFVNKVAELAEEQGHHPDISISYSKVGISLTTHAIHGLSTNDFIIASKIELLQNSN